MIKINLLPEELRQIERARRIRFNVTVFAGVAVALAVAVLVTVFYVIGQRARRFAQMKARLAELTPRSDEAKSLLEKEHRIEREFAVITGFSKRRILWNRHLNTVSDCLPDDLFLTNLSYNSKQRQVMIIRGEAPSVGGSGSVVTFIDNLRRNPSFIRDFPQISYLIDILPDGRQTFEIRCSRPRQQ